MKLNLVRTTFTPNSTIGKLSIDGVYFCFTLERPTDGKNVPNQSSIPEGTYSVTPRWSHHFGKEVLGLTGVPGRSDIEIHVANLPSQLLGCIAVGKKAGTDSISLSTVAFTDLMSKFRSPCTITIESVKRDVEPAPSAEAIA